VTPEERTALIGRLQKRPNFTVTEWFKSLTDDELASFAADCGIEVQA
jgi:hypothetical protein